MLFIFDFDGTIVSENTHNLLAGSSGNLEELWQILSRIEPVGGAEIWKETLQLLLKKGHHVAIASFNSFGGLLFPRYLKEVIGLELSEVDRICIHSWLPFPMQGSNKTQHIQAIQSELNYQGPTCLIDDDDNNLKAAKSQGLFTIPATGKHLLDVQKLALNPPKLGPFFRTVPFSDIPLLKAFCCYK
ncbi:hypothetical protein DIZ81_07385 [Legionella taurinensis]|uniref:Haloacid dehalogenase n=1 Tax=Legionella taurinensis TaxID=70611 RepID=A0A3A5LAC1_9GAMM|nr:hypothetical protein [Legionella taurinensis]MDX1837104.1 hypothetical protein [Legionella taurinensis]PUT40411.1 hypothetical protein DB744_07385 [Legionella taurinensis]PUT40497.1 hypothetical protein DB746_11455 [Legionella taurinensis]PUT42742.1 hypothetical protein DB743_11940 [Legionella taurinensis]PUT48473.1 hypothetical protein DB745_05785 [Legionella taurinensis]